MRRNKFLFLIFFALAIFAMGAILQRVSAQGITLNDFFFPYSQHNYPKITEELSNPLISQLTPLSREDISAPPAFVENSNDQIFINTVSDLISKVNKKHLIPGWLHITSIKERFPTTTKFLPNGVPIPTKSTNDAWYLLGENGDVSKAVIIDDTGEALTTQVVVFADGLWKNLAVPEANPTMKATKQIKTLDQGLLGNTSSRNKKLKFEKTESSTGDGNLILVTATEMFDSPMTFNQIVVSGMISKYTLSDTSGRILSVETYQIYPDSSIVLWDRITTTVVENSDTAPDKILNYLMR